MICRNRFKLCIFIVFLSTFHLNVKQVDSFSSQRQRYASRMLKITPKACSSPSDPSLTGICMISLECQQRSGTVIGACRDGHLFGACCHDPTPMQKTESDSSTTSATTITTTASTTTTMTSTEPPTTTTTTTTEPPQPQKVILNNEVSPDSSNEPLLRQQDTPTSIPSLLDTFSELSPTFLSELALDQHTTGMYASLPTVSGAELLRESIRNKNNEVSDEVDVSKNDDDESSSTSAAVSSTENSVYSSTKQMMSSSTSTTTIRPTSPSSSTTNPPSSFSESESESPDPDSSSVPVLPSSAPTMPVNKWKNPYWPMNFYSSQSNAVSSSSSSAYPTASSTYSTSQSPYPSSTYSTSQPPYPSSQSSYYAPPQSVYHYSAGQYYYPSAQSTQETTQNTYPSSQSTYQSSDPTYASFHYNYPSSEPSDPPSPQTTLLTSTSSEATAPAYQSIENTYPTADAIYDHHDQSAESEISYSSAQSTYPPSSSETPSTYYYSMYPSSPSTYYSPASSSSSPPSYPPSEEQPVSLPLTYEYYYSAAPSSVSPDSYMTTYSQEPTDYPSSSSTYSQPSSSAQTISASSSLAPTSTAPASSTSETLPSSPSTYASSLPRLPSTYASSTSETLPPSPSTYASLSHPTSHPSSTHYSSSPTSPSLLESTYQSSSIQSSPSTLRETPSTPRASPSSFTSSPQTSPTSSSSSAFPSSSSISTSPISTTTVEHEVGGLAALGKDPEFKDNVIKYIDDIVTMRNNNDLASSDDESPSLNDINDIPFSTFTIVSSTKSTENSSPVTWTWTTTGMGNTDKPTTFKYNIVSTGDTNLPPSKTTSAQRTSSEEVLSVSVAQTVAPLSGSTETNDLTSPDATSTTFEQTSPSSAEPTKFTFSKLKYTPRPYKPRPPTTRKIVWTRPTTTTPEPFYNKPLNIAEDDDDEDADEDIDDENENDNLLTGSSSSTAPPASTEQTTITTTTSTEGSSSSLPMEDDIEGHYDTTTDDASLFTSSSIPSITTGFGIDWASPTILSLIKDATENRKLENLYYGNASRSDFNGANGITGSSNDLTAPSSTTGASSTTGPSSPSTFEDLTTSGSSTLRTSTAPALISSSTERTSAPSAPTNKPSPSSWDSSIDSFVDQVVEGIVKDLNKNNNKKIDDMIFKGKKNKNGSKNGTTTTVSTTGRPSENDKRTISSTTPGNVRLTSFKSKYATAKPTTTSTEKSTKLTKVKKTKVNKPKTTKRPLFKTTTSSEAPVRSTTSKERLKQKVKVKVPSSNLKTRPKTKPVKKVTTASKTTPNSTKKRLDYKRDCGVRPMIKSGRIVGGTPSRFGSWPWHALVKETVWWGIFSKIKCGGVLIDAQHVLTAAHCQPQQTGTLSVVLGITDADDNRAITKTVRRVIPHPHFNPRTYENDIAILELESPVDFQPHIVPICLPRKDDQFEGKSAFVTGMGLLKHDGERPLVLQEVDLPILNNTECQKMFVRSGNKKPIIESFICAGYEQGRKDSCGGDSGGPLSVKRPNGQWALAGTVSHGIKCALPDQPGVYMRTSYYKPWIDRVLSVSRSRYRGIPRCNAPPMICARQRHHQQKGRDSGIVNTLFRIFRLARKMYDDDQKRSTSS